MAVNANLTTFPGAMMSPQDFAIMVEKISSQQTGILYGCTATSSGGSTINITSGWALVKGRLVQIDAGSMAIELPTSTVSKYLYIKIDLSNSDIPCSVVVENSTKTDSTDFNITDGIAYCLLATLTVAASGITNVSNAAAITSAEDAVNNLKNTDNKLAGSIATIETSPATANHSVGDLIIYNGQLYLVTTAITAGSTLGGKITPTTADAQFAHTRIVTSGSMNSLTKSGIYYCTSAVTDMPIDGGGVLVIGAYNNETATATFISYVTAGAVAFGRRNASGWVWVRTPNLSSVNVSGTTSSSGAIDVPVAYRTQLFVGAVMTSQVGFVFKRDFSYFTVMNNDLNSAIANTEVTFTAYFLSI